MRLGLVSAKGSPGVTTLVLGAAAIMDAHDSTYNLP